MSVRTRHAALAWCAALAVVVGAVVVAGVARAGEARGLDGCGPGRGSLEVRADSGKVAVCAREADLAHVFVEMARRGIAHVTLVGLPSEPIRVTVAFVGRPVEEAIRRVLQAVPEVTPSVSVTVPQAATGELPSVSVFFAREGTAFAARAAGTAGAPPVGGAPAPEPRAASVAPPGVSPLRAAIEALTPEDRMNMARAFAGRQASEEELARAMSLAVPDEHMLRELEERVAAGVEPAATADSEPVPEMPVLGEEDRARMLRDLGPRTEELLKRGVELPLPGSQPVR